MKLIVPLILAVFASGCASGKATISASSDRIHELAGSSLVHVARLEQFVDDGGKLELAGIRTDQEAIQAEVTGRLKPAIDRVEDKPGLLDAIKRYLVWAAWIVGVLILVVFLGNLGIPGPAALLVWLGKKGITLTRGAVDQARLAAQMTNAVEKHDTPTEVKTAVDSFVSSLRTLSPSVSGRYSMERKIVRK